MNVQYKRVLALVLALALTVPAASAGVTGQANSSPSTSVDDGVSQTDAATNYTQLYVDDQYRSLDLGPGDNETVSITVENGEDEAVTIDPHVWVPPVGERPVESEWVTMDTGETTIAAGESMTINATVEVPEDAELGRYSGAIAFTNETISYPGQPERPLHSASLRLRVSEPPTVTLQSGRHGYTQVQAGETTVHEIVVRNDGDQAVPLNPQVSTESNRRHYRANRRPMDESWFEIDAPAEVEAGETATVEVTIAPPEDADRGRYDAEINLGLQDPARPDRSDYWQRVRMNVEVWEQPSEPFETSFEVEEDTENATLTLSTHNRRGAEDAPEPDFDVTFVAPDGTEIDAERVERTTSGSVSLAADHRERRDGEYAGGTNRQTFTYRLDDPEAGEWSVRIMPENAMDFGYEITRSESGD